ncbi:MAG TPA: VTT domain-containing protein [Bryobacteraceae bacterium]|nr:VTT domain-containing protein [Bryobacteraceae bacterium]
MRPALRWTIIGIVTLAAILIPFVLFEDRMNAWSEGLTRPNLPPAAIAGAVVLLLVLDVLLPIPSSIVSTAAGAGLGFLAGCAASTAGLTGGSLLGYALGRRFGLPLIRRTVGERDLQHLSERFHRGAAWALVALRPVPVLAEASGLFAGVTAVPLPLYIAVTTLSNAGISAVYCWAGASASGRGSFLLAFAASIALPGAAMVLSRLLARRK